MAFRIPLIAVVALLVGLIDLVTTSPPFLSAVNERLAGAFIPIQDWWNGPAGGTGGGDTLRQALQHSTIVQLGEAQHGDGATFERKNAWIRHLHEKFQFDVLLFESGIWAGIPLDRALRSGHAAPEDVDRHLWHFWAKAKETETLWTYLAHAGIQVGGFDLQFTGQNPDVLAQLRAMAGNLHYSDADWANTRRWLERMQVAKMNGFHKNPPEDDKRRIVQEISAFSKSLETDTTPSGAYDRLLLRNLCWNITYWELPEEARNPFRDSIMAGNILELQKHVFPGKKIIVWAANAHILHNSRADGIYPFRSMGDYLWAQLGDQSFAALMRRLVEADIDILGVETKMSGLDHFFKNTAL